jgi:hypothetical protein
MTLDTPDRRSSAGSTAPPQTLSAAARQQATETSMAKDRKRGNREVKKPKTAKKPEPIARSPFLSGASGSKQPAAKQGGR